MPISLRCLRSPVFAGKRAIREHQQRIVAVAFLLEDCGEKKPEDIVVNLLGEQNVKAKASSVIRTIATYKAAAETGHRTDALILPDNLPEYWLERLSWFYEYWKWKTQAVPDTQSNGSLRATLDAFVKEFLRAATFTIT